MVGASLSTQVLGWRAIWQTFFYHALTTLCPNGRDHEVRWMQLGYGSLIPVCDRP